MFQEPVFGKCSEESYGSWVPEQLFRRYLKMKKKAAGTALHPEDAEEIKKVERALIGHPMNVRQYLVDCALVKAEKVEYGRLFMRKASLL